MPLIIKGRKRVEKKKAKEAQELECPETKEFIEDPLPKMHECGICHYSWLCGLRKCQEPEIPEMTECRKCKCGLPQCFLMESE